MAEDVQVGTDLQLELGPPPVAALGVVADRVAGPHPDPLRDRSVLLQLLGQLDLDAESLVGRLKVKRNMILRPMIERPLRAGIQ